MTYDEAQAILDNCNHPHMSDGNPWCLECWNAHVRAWREARKAELAEHNAKLPRCQHCGKRPFKWYYGPYLLCGYCLTAARKEHNKALSGAGNLAFIVGMLATKPLVDTTDWAANQNKKEGE